MNDIHYIPTVLISRCTEISIFFFIFTGEVGQITLSGAAPVGIYSFVSAFPTIPNVLYGIQRIQFDSALVDPSIWRGTVSRSIYRTCNYVFVSCVYLFVTW